MYTNYRPHSTDREITCTSCITIKLILFKSYNKMLSLVVYAGVNVLVARISGNSKRTTTTYKKWQKWLEVHVVPASPQKSGWMYQRQIPPCPFSLQFLLSLILRIRKLNWCHHIKKLLFLILSCLLKSFVSFVFNVAEIACVILA